MLNTKLLLVIIAIVQISRVNSFANNIPGQCVNIGSLNIQPLNDDISMLAGVWYTMIESTTGPNIESEQSRSVHSLSDSDTSNLYVVEKFTNLVTQKNEQIIFNETSSSPTELRFSLTRQDQNNNVESGFDCAVLLLTTKNMISYCCKNVSGTKKTEELALYTRDVSQSLQIFIDLIQDCSKENNIMSSYAYTQLVYRKNLKLKKN